MNARSRSVALAVVGVLVLAGSDLLPFAQKPAFLHTLAVAVAIWFGATGLFVLCSAAKAAIDSGKLTTFWYVNVLPFALLFAALDPLFNFTFGTVMFLELPHEWLFTARCKRHKAPFYDTTVPYGTEPWRCRFAIWWCRQLNVFDAGHC